MLLHALQGRAQDKTLEKPEVNYQNTKLPSWRLPKSPDVFAYRHPSTQVSIFILKSGFVLKLSDIAHSSVIE